MTYKRIVLTWCSSQWLWSTDTDVTQDYYPEPHDQWCVNTFVFSDVFCSNVCPSLFYSFSESAQNIRIRWIPLFYCTTARAVLDNHLGNRQIRRHESFKWPLQSSDLAIYFFLWGTLRERICRYVRKPETQKDKVDCVRQKVATFLFLSLWWFFSLSLHAHSAPNKRGHSLNLCCKLRFWCGHHW